MKNKSYIRIGLGVLAALSLNISNNLYGAVYVDTFSDNSGALNGRTTAAGFGAWTTSDSAFQVGNGTITINSNDPAYHAATFSLPTLTVSDTLTLTLTVRPSGSGFLGFGFTPNSGQYVINNGYTWTYYEGLGSGNPNIQIFNGSGTAGATYYASLTNPALNFDASLPTTFQYTYSASTQRLSLSAVNGSSTSTLLNNANVSSIPLSAFSNFSLQFQGQTLGLDTNPSYVDYLRVEVVPEPSTFAMLLGGLGTMVLRRRR
jgi:hypothetical protein